MLAVVPEGPLEPDRVLEVMEAAAAEWGSAVVVAPDREDCECAPPPILSSSLALRDSRIQS